MNLLGPYKYAIDALVIAALLAGAAWLRHWDTTTQQAIGAARVQAQWAEQKSTDERAAAALRAQYQKEKDDAEVQAAKNIQVANVAAAAANQSSRVLDATVKAVLSASANGTVEANRRYASALAEVFGDCKDKYRQLGREAQGHADDSLKFQNAWPISPEVK